MKLSLSTSVLVWTVMFLLSAVAAVGSPHFAERTGLACITCHNMPTYPRLTPFGIRFRDAGYTVPGKYYPIRKFGDLVSAIPKFPVVPYFKPDEGIKVHIGGALYRTGDATFGAFVQPMINNPNTGDFNLVQGVVAGKHWRFLGGRLPAVSDGGQDACGAFGFTSPQPILFRQLHGVAVGLGHGARLELMHRGSKLSLFANDLHATTRTPVYGVLLSTNYDRKTASYLQFFWLRASRLGGQDITAERYGALVNRSFVNGAGREVVNVAAGVMFGNESRPIRAGVSDRMAVGYLELSYSPNQTYALMLRQEYQKQEFSNALTGRLTFGATLVLDKRSGARADFDLIQQQSNAWGIQLKIRTPVRF
jgi:hypothetical protein